MHFVLKDECYLQNLVYMLCRRETKSQAVANILPLWGVAKNLVKAVALIGDKVIGKAIATVIEHASGVRGAGGLGACS